MSTFAEDFTGQLIALIEDVAASSDFATPSSTDVDSTTAKPWASHKLLNHSDLLRLCSDSDTSDDPLRDACLLVHTIGQTLQTVLERAAALNDETEYWRLIEQRSSERALYFIQTLPQRIYKIAHAANHKFKRHGAFTRKDLLRPSLLVTSLFPRLSNSLATSPDLLIVQEARMKKEALRKGLEQAAAQIASLVASFTNLRTALEQHARNPTTPASTATAFSTLATLCAAIDTQSSPNDAAMGNGNRVHAMLARDSKAAELDTILKRNQRPSFWIRAWPRVVFYPLAAIIAAKMAYNSREWVFAQIVNAKETLRGFITGWVIEPVVKILDTVRHGSTGNSLALMGKASLDSDLSSLERMVVDFGRDCAGLPPDTLHTLGAKVKEGDMTLIMREWEDDIKTPFKSAVTGTLIRVLLIQIQKVKVDVDLAMSGIEKLLQSQQLTFAFVGVAPSLLVLIGVGKYLRSIFSSASNSRSSSQMRRDRIQVWNSLREIDHLLIQSGDAENTQDQDFGQIGYLLIQTQILRNFVNKGSFPSRNRDFKEAFIADVRLLEETNRKREALDRIVTYWTQPLRLSPSL